MWRPAPGGGEGASVTGVLARGRRLLGPGALVALLAGLAAPAASLASQTPRGSSAQPRQGLPALTSPSGPAPLPYGQFDAGGFRNVLPAGQGGLDNLIQLGQFEAGGARPPHTDDQLAMYRDLLYGYRGLGAGDLGRYFKDATFGVPLGQAERTYSPRADVTIVRDAYGVPHVYGATRAGAMFGIGYATAEDRLFFIDVFRHLGRAQLSSFVGGSPANRAFDHLMWRVAPYTESDLQRQIDAPRPGFEAESAQLRSELDQYVAGINQYITEARADPSKMPGEYAAIGHPEGPTDWKPTDTVATAGVIGAIFGVGGGAELDGAQTLEDAQARFGSAGGWRAWNDFRSADVRDAPTTVRGRRFASPPVPRHPSPALALFDRGSLARPDIQVAGSGSGTQAVPGVPGTSAGSDAARASAPRPGAASASGALARARQGLLAFPHAMSNALLISGRDAAGGHPLAVFGPQTGYFTPEVLMEQELQAPGLSARGVAFPGVNLYVQIGHGTDYAWSATTSAQDIVDTFALDLCDPAGGPPTTASTGYRDGDRCVPMEILDRTNSWQPTAADNTPAGQETLRAQRTRLGLVVGRGTIGVRPVAYTRLRSTYLHEPDAGLAFSYFNDPARMRTPADFQRAASLIGYTFNWFYVDAHHVAYQNSGWNPRRAAGTDPDLPILGQPRYEWRDYHPDALTLAAFTAPAEHPQFLDQEWAADWNNKQAPGYRAADDNWGYTATYRQKLLADRVHALAATHRATLPQLASAMEDAATVDLRADAVLPYALRVIGEPADPTLRHAVDELRAWVADGGHRIDPTRSGTYDHAQAIRILDAWWPRWMHAEFEPVLGPKLFADVQRMNRLTNDPNNDGDHVGSSWQGGWEGYALEDLRDVLSPRRAVKPKPRKPKRRRAARRRRAPRGVAHRRKRHRAKRRPRRRPGRRRPAAPAPDMSRVYCGNGSLAACRAALESSLHDALGVSAAQLYGGDAVCQQAGRDGDQACYDAIWFRPLGAITQRLLAWVNRPTFQQAVEVPGQIPRP